MAISYVILKFDYIFKRSSSGCQVVAKCHFSKSNDIDSTCVELLPLLSKMQNIVRRKHILSPFMFPHTRLFEHEKHILLEMLCKYMCVELLPLLAKMQNIVRRKHIFSHFMFLIPYFLQCETFRAYLCMHIKSIKNNRIINKQK